MPSGLSWTDLAARDTTTAGARGRLSVSSFFITLPFEVVMFVVPVSVVVLADRSPNGGGGGALGSGGRFLGGRPLGNTDESRGRPHPAGVAPGAKCLARPAGTVSKRGV
jgi:hypothetical protein